jgi:hypothetical protein
MPRAIPETDVAPQTRTCELPAHRQSKSRKHDPHAMFLRTECVLPYGLDLITRAVLRNMDVCQRCWHFMWLEDAYARFGVGRTATSAIDKAIASTLDRIKDRFNAAELESVSVSKYVGFWVAKMTLYARQIQHQASLSLVDEMTIRQLAAL